MLRFILRRALLAIPSLFGLLVLTFFLIRVVPADPAAALAGENATPAQVAEIRRQYGRPASVRAVRRLSRAGRPLRVRGERLFAAAGFARHQAAPAGDARAHHLGAPHR